MITDTTGFITIGQPHVGVLFPSRTRMHARAPTHSGRLHVSVPQSCADLREEWRPLGVSSSLSPLCICCYVPVVELRPRAIKGPTRTDALSR